MTPVTPGKGRAVKRRWPTDDNPTDSEEEEHRQTSRVCKQCNMAICRNDANVLALHSSTHLSFRPWKCSVCAYTATRKGGVQIHLNEQHQGNGGIIDNRTAEYYDGLEAKMKANFPCHSNAIAKYIGGLKEAVGFQDASGDEDDNAQDGRKILSCRQCTHAIVSTRTTYLAEHSAAHLSFRPWQCSVCTFTAKLKSVVKHHLKTQHQGNGRIIDSRTAEYYDALEAKTKANFPGHSSAIAKYIGRQKEALGFQDASDHEDDNPQDGRKISRCTECGNSIRQTSAKFLAQHSVTHLSFRPWKCSVCNHVAKLKHNMQQHLNGQHQGNGRVIDNRTAEYYDALKAKTQANFPSRAKAIAKLIGGQRHVSGILDDSDDEDDTREDNPPMVHLPAPGDKILEIRRNVQTNPEIASSNAGTIKQEVMPDADPRRSKEKSTHRTIADTHREVKQEPLDVENSSFDFHVVVDGSEADAHADAHAPIRHHNQQNVRNGDKDQSSSPTLHPIVVKQELLDGNPNEEPRRMDKKKKKKKMKRGEEDWAAEVAVLTIPSESPPFHANSAFSPPSRVAVVQPRIEPVPQIDTDHSIDKRFEETIMTMKLGGAKISSDMARTRAAMRETKSDVARMQINMALLESLSETRNAENRRLRQENDQQAAKLEMLMEEVTALRDRIRNG